MLPVTAKAPIIDCLVTVDIEADARQQYGKGSLYSPGTQYNELCKYLEGVEYTEQVEPSYRGRHGDKVGISMWAIIKVLLGHGILGRGRLIAVDSERARVAMLQY